MTISFFQNSNAGVCGTDQSSQNNVGYENFSPDVTGVEENSSQQLFKNKFVRSRAKEQHTSSSAFLSKVVPSDVRHWTEILEIDFLNITAIEVHSAWRKQMASSAVHPDLGGNAELAILMTKAKDELLHWVDLNTPKLGKQFSHLAK